MSERTVSCRFVTAVKRQMLIGPFVLISERSSVMAFIGVRYEKIKVYETLTKIKQKYDKIKFDKI